MSTSARDLRPPPDRPNAPKAYSTLDVSDPPSQHNKLRFNNGFVPNNYGQTSAGPPLPPRESQTLPAKQPPKPQPAQPQKQGKFSLFGFRKHSDKIPEKIPEKVPLKEPAPPPQGVFISHKDLPQKIAKSREQSREQSQRPKSTSTLVRARVWWQGMIQCCRLVQSMKFGFDH